MISNNTDYSKIIISKEMLEKLNKIKDKKFEHTKENDKIILEYYNKKDKTELSKVLNMSLSSLRNRYFKLTQLDK